MRSATTLYLMGALVAAEKRSPLDDALFRASLLERRVSMLESHLTKTEEAHHDISALLQSQEDRPADVLPSGAGRSPRRDGSSRCAPLGGATRVTRARRASAPRT